MTQEAASLAASPFPIRLTSFVGRVAELRNVRDALGRYRLVTLVGPGGAGKTRLAVEAAGAPSSAQRWYVDLAPVQDGTKVVTSLAVATGAPEGPGEDPLQAIVRRIGHNASLMLVDNCDQVLDSCAAAIDVLLRSCPELTILATSREPLRVEGERLLRVPPLSMPSGEDDLDGDAVLLFLDRAQMTREAGLHVRAGIRHICRRLDGMPLAIELAAARAAALSVPDILTGLGDRFRLLADGPRTADHRQRSLATSIQWSYRLLTDDESTILQRLAVFRSPFSAEAAAAVAAGDGIARPNVVPGLARLVEKSLVVIDERGDVSRYRLLETIREYAVEMLEATPSDAGETRNRHLRYFRETAERMEPVFRRQPPPQWIARFESELPDVRAAISWAAETHQADEAMRLVGSLSRFWWVRARADGGHMIAEALAIDGGDPRWRAQALTAATLAALARYDPRALDLGREAVRLAESCGDSATAARAHCWLGWTRINMDLAGARPDLIRARDLARDAGDPSTEATALNGLVGTEIGDSIHSARATADEALALASHHDDAVEICSANLWLATIAMVQGRITDVDDAARRSLSLAESMSDVTFTAYARLFLARCAMTRGDAETASDHIDVITALAEESANSVLQGYSAALRAQVDFGYDGDYEALERIARALPALSVFPHGLYAAWFADSLTDAALQKKRPDDARQYANAAARYAEDGDNDWARSRAMLAAARVNAHHGEVQAAGRDLQRVLEHAERADDSMTTIDALELLARLEHESRAPESATRLLAATAAARVRTEYLYPPLGAAGLEALTADLRSDLGDGFDQSWSEGSELSLDDAVALAQRGRGSRRRPATGWDSLTPAETRVVALVGDGLTNPQIAGRLFVGTDTVKGHVSAAFRKLGVANRTELAAEAARRGVADQR